MGLNEIRMAVARVIMIAVVVFSGVILATEWYEQGALGLATIVAVPSALLLAALYVFTSRGQSFRYAVGAVTMAEVVALIIAMRGNPWQIDMHLAFFAALAVTAMTYDVRAIILATVLVAVHHLTLGLLVPFLVFYGGGGIERVMIHAVILVVEGGSLAWMTFYTQSLLGLAAARGEEAAQEAGKVRAMAESAEAERAEHGVRHSRMLTRLEESFGRVVAAANAGEFSERVAADFDDEVLNRLAVNINKLVETVDRGLTETGEVLSALARTDLRRRVNGSYLGAFARLKDDVNAVAQRLTEIIGSLRITSRSLRVATTEISGGASDLSSRTAKQAVTIEETSAAVNQLSSTVVKNAERARDASVNADHVTHTAEESGEVMHKATDAMERITASSSKISNIIGLIDDIAFQTNLLALNASVEAARAGEAGKGFAVVAVEVRRLAQSAAEASKEIKGLIDQSGREVKTGSHLVEQAAERLEAMLQAARANNQLLDGIARDSRDQASAIEEINSAMRQLDEMTQHNASLVEETNAAIAQTEGQAADLDRVVDLFAMDERVAASSAGATPNAGARTGPAAAGDGVRKRQDTVKEAAKSYLGHGRAPLRQEWSRF